MFHHQIVPKSTECYRDVNLILCHHQTMKKTEYHNISLYQISVKYRLGMYAIMIRSVLFILWFVLLFFQLILRTFSQLPITSQEKLILHAYKERELPALSLVQNLDQSLTVTFNKLSASTTSKVPVLFAFFNFKVVLFLFCFCSVLFCYPSRKSEFQVRHRTRLCLTDNKNSE